MYERTCEGGEGLEAGTEDCDAEADLPVAESTAINTTKEKAEPTPWPPGVGSG